MTEADGPILYDRDYVKTCLRKVIEEKPQGYSYPAEEFNRYFDVCSDSGSEEVTPSCLVGHVLGFLGMSEQTMAEIADGEYRHHNYDCISDLVKLTGLPVTDDAIELLSRAQIHNDLNAPWEMFLPYLN